MKRIMLGAIAAFAATPLAAGPVSVASGNWSDIPAVAKKGNLRISSQAVDLIAAAVEAGKCPAAGTKRHIQLSVPFLIEFASTGEVRQVVVYRINCPEVEQVLGGTVLELAQAGEYRPTGMNQTGWYRGQVDLDAR